MHTTAILACLAAASCMAAFLAFVFERKNTREAAERAHRALASQDDAELVALQAKLAEHLEAVRECTEQLEKALKRLG